MPAAACRPPTAKHKAKPSDSGACARAALGRAGSARWKGGGGGSNLAAEARVREYSRAWQPGCERRAERSARLCRTAHANRQMQPAPARRVTACGGKNTVCFVMTALQPVCMSSRTRSVLALAVPVTALRYLLESCPSVA
jgi:hypothetical protein